MSFKGYNMVASSLLPKKKPRWLSNGVSGFELHVTS